MKEMFEKFEKAGAEGAQKLPFVVSNQDIQKTLAEHRAELKKMESIYAPKPKRVDILTKIALAISGGVVLPSLVFWAASGKENKVALTIALWSSLAGLAVNAAQIAKNMKMELDELKNTRVK